MTVSPTARASRVPALLVEFAVDVLDPKRRGFDSIAQYGCGPFYDCRLARARSDDRTICVFGNPPSLEPANNDPTQNV